jgi:NAD(P)-dependent dehydrogenase (short-subunit alcohol dehydrogenase family)
MHTTHASVLLGALGIGTYFMLRKRSEQYSFYGKTVIITGGSRGLGLLMAEELAREGANLVITARHAEQLAEAEEVLRAHGASVMAIRGDIRDQQHAQDVIRHTVARFGRLDVLINNAGVIKTGPVEHMVASDWQEAIETHVYGPLYTMLAAHPIMKEQGAGRIVNIASIGGLIAVPHLLPYCTSKFGLVGLSDGMRAELVKDNILVTTVCPGLMRTGSHTEAMFKGNHEQEYTWFSLLDTSPLTSIDARDAARQILEACRQGQAKAIISPQAQVATLVNRLMPVLTEQTLNIAHYVLPKAVGPTGDISRTGWEVELAHDTQGR